ncbi:MAG: helix-hairpin-helix domain-containing protein [Clostridiales bacterium]|nr:helix-hairpin-helix domain-containing protein [Clostridiales bacterium]
MKKTGRIILIVTIIIAVSSTVILSIINASENRKMINGIEREGIEAIGEDILKIKIYVTGEVVTPGIVEIEKGATILDVVNACGGFTELASNNINLVYSLEKNVTLIIKAKDDGGGATVLETPGDAIIIDNENGLIDGKININHADAGALGLLPGIGEKTALDIIEYREQNGMFEKIEEIMNVPGIKESKFSKIKDYICIE